MSSSEVAFGKAWTVRKRQYCKDSNGNDWTRKINADGSKTDWKLVESDNSAPKEEPTYLYIVQQVQAEGQPMHWSLFVAREVSVGSVYQVKGDATLAVRRARADGFLRCTVSSKSQAA